MTGASGFAAEHLIPKLNDIGWLVIGIDKLNAASADCHLFIQADLSSTSGIDKIKEKICNIDIDLCIHLAAARADWGVSDDQFINDNVIATKNLLSLVAHLGIKRHVFVSSISVMPQDSQSIIDEQAPYEPINIYGRTKMLAEQEYISYTQQNTDCAVNIIRPTVLFGPSDPKKTGLYRAMDNNIYRMIDAINKKRFAIVGPGATVKSTAFILNFCDAILHLIPSKPGYDIWIYADENPITTLEITQIIRQALGLRGDGLKLPYAPIHSAAKMFDWLGKKLEVNFPITQSRVETFNRPTNFSSKRLRNNGFKQKYDTRDALKKTATWYKELNKNTIKSFWIKK